MVKPVSSQFEIKFISMLAKIRRFIRERITIKNKELGTNKSIYNPPYPLSNEEQAIYDRFYEIDFTFDESLEFYRLIILNGRKFPAEWESRVLNIGTAEHFNTQTIFDRLQNIRDGVTSEMELTQEKERIVIDSRRRFLSVCNLVDNSLPSHGIRWGAYKKRMGDAIDKFRLPIEVLHFAQSEVGFEHRGNIHHEGKFTAMYERELAASFPQYSHLINDFADIAESVPITIYQHNGRLISNILFYLARIIMSCLENLQSAPHRVLEIGGGYGAPARLWMTNPIAKPTSYVILDMPESLYFCDVFLRNEFGSENVHYVTSNAPLSQELINEVKFILCPLPFYKCLTSLSIDLTINTGSLQEMSEEWVEFYKNFLETINCKWFYSLNYFSQPINELWESGNLFSPRLSNNWSARLLRFNPSFVRMQSERNYLEALYEKDYVRLSSDDAIVLCNSHLSRNSNGEGLTELFDIIRRSNDPVLLYKVLEYAMKIPSKPKEALWLAEQLSHAELSQEANRRIEAWKHELLQMRATGVEAYY